MGAVEHHDSGDGSLILDDRLFPVVLGTWIGEIDVSMVELYYGWLDGMIERAESEHTRIVTVTDGLDARRPRGEVRRAFAEHTDARQASMDRAVIGTVVATRGPVLLGAVAAVFWMMRGGPRLLTTSDMPKALERTRKILVANGVRPPRDFDPSRYERPPRPSG
ncbi:MAG: hypothetical protein AAF799_36820 [Myxococcota bacterium]